MFGKNKPPKPSKDALRAYEAAKEATRRATFLHQASDLPESDPFRQDLAMLFRVCRASALATGAAAGKTPDDIDAEISALCDADVARLKKASNKAVQNFARESHKITKAFLASVNPEALAATTQQATKH
jgi:hypothetical protein